MLTVFTPQQFARFATGLAGTSLHDQWGGTVAKVGGKVYAVFTPQGEAPARIVFKCAQQTFEILTALEGIAKAPYFAKRQWVSVAADADLTAPDLAAYLRLSYQTVAAGLPKRVRAEIGL